MTDLGVIALRAGTHDDVEPVSFGFSFTMDGDEKTETFQAKGWIPFAHLVDFWAAPESAAMPAMLAFLGRALLADEWPRFYTLLTDERASADAGALQDLTKRLLTYYATVDPTTARSGGPKPSANGRRSTGGGSSGRSRAKAKTSR